MYEVYGVDSVIGMWCEVCVAVCLVWGMYDGVYNAV